MEISTAQGFGGGGQDCLNPSTHTRLLFVDDEAPLRAAMARMLGRRGFLVDVASSTDEALALAENAEYPVVATDLSMPGGGGIDLIRRLHRRCPDTVFVIVTGHSDIDVPLEPGFRDNVVSIITKPCDPEELVEALQRSVKLSASRRSETVSQEEIEPELRRVLLLEDMDSDAELIEAYLSMSPHAGEVRRARRLSDALELLDQDDFGVIIADLSLPDARGLDSVLRLQTASSTTPLIVLSGVDDEAVAMQAVQAGAQDFLLKGGVDPERLVRSIRYACERKRFEQSLAQLAHFDPLTHLANRAHFEQRLGHTLARAKRTGEPFAVAFVDLDEFKPVNDRLGHAAGDALLVEAGRRLVQAVREYDTVARLGGDEFAVILNGLADRNQAPRIAERMLSLMARPHFLEEGTARVTASIGLAVYPDAGRTAVDLLKAADQAMYGAKRRGRNTFEVARGRSAEPVSGDLCAELGRAVADEEFFLRFRSRRGLGDAALHGAEAVVHWDRHRRRVLDAGEFYPLLEGATQASAIARWAIEEGCAVLERWQAQGDQHAVLSLDVSPFLHGDGSLTRTVAAALRETSFEAKRLELRVSEAAVMKEPERAQEVLRALRSQGVALALCDFAGVAALASLYELPIDAVAVAPSLLERVAAGQLPKGVLGALIALATKLGLRTIAPPVECPDVRRLLAAEGCTAMTQTPLLGADEMERAVCGARGALASVFAFFGSEKGR